MTLPSLTGVLNFYWGGHPAFKGQSLSVIAGLVLGALATGLLFGHQKANGRPPARHLSGVALIGLVWLVLAIRTSQEGLSVNYLTYLIPLLVFGTLYSPPNLRQATTAARIFGLSIVVAGSLTIAMQVFAQLPSGFGPLGGVQRLGILTELGLEWRWYGPFGHSNLAGPLGAVAAMIGVTCRHFLRAVLVSGGVIMMAISQSRTGLLAAICAVALTLFAVKATTNKRLVGWPLIVSLAILAVLTTYVALYDPTLSFRTVVWRDYFELWLSEPVAGLGKDGIDAFVDKGITASGLPPHSHAHHLVLDQAARWGALPAVLSATILLIGIYLGLKAVKSGAVLGLMLSIFMTLVASLETPLDWIYASPLFITLYLSLILSAAALTEPRKSLRNRHKGLHADADNQSD